MKLITDFILQMAFIYVFMLMMLMFFIVPILSILAIVFKSKTLRNMAAAVMDFIDYLMPSSLKK